MVTPRAIILHIGLPKTGSTTIQQFLYVNQRRLAEQGYAFLRSLGQPNNTGLVLHCRNFGRAASERRSLRYRKGIRSEADLASYRKTLEVALEGEVSALPGSLGTIVMSCELCARLHDDEIRRLQALLAPFASSIEILLYLRGQDDVIRSSYTTTLRVGHSVSFSKWIDKEIGKDMYRYADLIARWAAVFGEEALKVRLFRKDLFKEGDLVADFCDAVGVGERACFDQVSPRNQSLRHGVQRLLRAFNEHYPKRPGEGALRALAILTTVMRREAFVGQGASLEAKTANEILDAFQAQNAQVRDDRFPDLEELFPRKLDQPARRADDAEEILLACRFMYEAIVEGIRVEAKKGRKRQLLEQPGE